METSSFPAYSLSAVKSRRKALGEVDKPPSQSAGELPGVRDAESGNERGGYRTSGKPSARIEGNGKLEGRGRRAKNLRDKITKIERYSGERRGRCEQGRL